MQSVIPPLDGGISFHTLLPFKCEKCVLLQDAFSLLAYSDPWNSPVGYQLDPIQREPVCSTLNSAILGRSDSDAFDSCVL